MSYFTFRKNNNIYRVVYDEDEKFVGIYLEVGPKQYKIIEIFKEIGDNLVSLWDKDVIQNPQGCRTAIDYYYHLYNLLGTDNYNHIYTDNLNSISENKQD